VAGDLEIDADAGNEWRTVDVTSGDPDIPDTVIEMLSMGVRSNC